MRSLIVTLAIPVSVFLVDLTNQRAILAQSTIMNVPSTDVVAAKKAYVEFDFITNYAWQRNGSFQTYIPRVVVGVGRNLEIGVNVSYTHVAGEPEPIELQPNIKWRFYRNEGSGTSAAIGCILYARVTRRAGANTVGLCYAVGRKRFPGRLRPRLTGGVYGLLNARDDGGTKACGLVGYQQPLSRKVELIIDWFGGNNRFGYISPGLSFSTSKNSALTTGYTIANHGRGKNALFAYYGLQF